MAMWTAFSMDRFCNISACTYSENHKFNFKRQLKRLSVLVNVVCAITYIGLFGTGVSLVYCKRYSGRFIISLYITKLVCDLITY